MKMPNFTIIGLFWLGAAVDLWVPPTKGHSLQLRHNERDGLSNHQPHDYLLNRLFRRKSNKTPKLHVTDFCAGIHRWPVNSPHKRSVTRKMFPFDDVIMDEVNVSMSWRLMQEHKACFWLEQTADTTGRCWPAANERITVLPEIIVSVAELATHWELHKHPVSLIDSMATILPDRELLLFRNLTQDVLILSVNAYKYFVF